MYLPWKSPIYIKTGASGDFLQMDKAKFDYQETLGTLRECSQDTHLDSYLYISNSRIHQAFAQKYSLSLTGLGLQFGLLLLADVYSFFS